MSALCLGYGVGAKSFCFFVAIHCPVRGRAVAVEHLECVQDGRRVRAAPRGADALGSEAALDLLREAAGKGRDDVGDPGRDDLQRADLPGGAPGRERLLYRREPGEPAPAGSAGAGVALWRPHSRRRWRLDRRRCELRGARPCPARRRRRMRGRRRAAAAATPWTCSPRSGRRSTASPPCWPRRPRPQPRRSNRRQGRTRVFPASLISSTRSGIVVGARQYRQPNLAAQVSARSRRS
jgi:hypothetical protein